MKPSNIYKSSTVLFILLQAQVVCSQSCDGYDYCTDSQTCCFQDGTYQCCDDDSDDGISPWVIVLIVACGILCVVAIIWRCYRRSLLSREANRPIIVQRTVVIRHRPPEQYPGMYTRETAPIVPNTAPPSYDAVVGKSVSQNPPACS